jgi:cyclomaltodextrinase / maltogenic alpha-amylase / neopullulanase
MAESQVSTDFIFGTLASSEDRIQALTASWRGLSAPALDTTADPWSLTLMAGPDAPVADVTVYYTLDGSDPQSGAATIPMVEQPPVWNTLLWGYVRPFAATFPHVPMGAMLRYRVSGRTQGGDTIRAAGGRRFSHFNAAYSVPGWVCDAVIYHIFVDRFATHDGTPFANHEDLSGFYGGTLRGITERLDYITELGANVLWLSPIFRSPSHHGYDATDLQEIEPRLGTKADLRVLVEAAHTRGIRILLDFVPNHVSNEHPFFQSASRDPASPYRDYFTFTDWPTQYNTFFGVRTLPQINNDHPAARRHIIDSAVYWLTEFGIDGFRLDYANGPQHDFWADYYAAVKQVSPDSFHVGEIVETPELIRSYEGRMDGALDFHFLQVLRGAFAFDTLNVEQFDDWLARHEAYFRGRNFVLPTFLDNHDMNRLLWITRGDTRRLKLAALLQFTLPAPPIIYYGTEVGLSQLRDVRQGSRGIPEESRLPMRWSDQDADLLTYYRRLVTIRRQRQSIWRSPRRTLLADGPGGRYSYAYGTSDTDAEVIVLINNAPQGQSFTVGATGHWEDLINGGVIAANGALSMSLAPYTGTVLARVAG